MVKTPPMSPTVKQIIKDISSNYVEADMAGRRGDHDTELKHLFFAIHDCYVLLTLFHSDGWAIDKELALSYANSGVNTAKRIEELVKEIKEQ